MLYCEKKVSPFSTITQVTRALERNCENIKLRENRREELVSLTTLGYTILDSAYLEICSKPSLI